MDQKLFYEANRPIVKIHGEIEERMHDQDKREFGGIYYTNKARKLHVALLEGSHYAFEEKIVAQDVELHSVRHSWDYLNGVQEAVNSLAGSYGIHGSGLEAHNNRIYISVDEVNADITAAIQSEMRKLGYSDLSAYTIRVMPHAYPFQIPDDETKDDETDQIEENTTSLLTEPRSSNTIYPGGMIVYRNSSGGYSHLASVNFGYILNGVPFIVGAGHACSDNAIGRDAYFVPYSGSGYPISNVAATYNSGNRFKIGTVALRNCGGNYDFHTIRVTESGLNFTYTCYNGWEISSGGGTVSQGSALRICGITTRYDAGYEYGYCVDAQASVSAYDTLMTNLIQADFGANNGTSGGPLITVDSDGSIRLVGSASVNSTSSFYCTRIQYMVDAYGLTVMPEGSISV